MKTPSTEDAQPDRQNLGPTGPATVSSETKANPEKKRPHAGNVVEAGKPLVGPTPTDDPDGNASQLQNEIDKKRHESAPD